MPDEEIAILKFALAREREGAKFYREKMKDMHVKEIREIFEELSRMETDHVAYISKLLEEISRGDEIIFQLDIKESIFATRENIELNGISVDSIAGDLSILRMAYLIEKDFEDFYKEKAETVSREEVKELLMKLSAWEEGHKKVLLDLYDILMDEYWNEQQFEPLF